MATKILTILILLSLFAHGFIKQYKANAGDDIKDSDSQSHSIRTIGDSEMSGISEKPLLLIALLPRAAYATELASIVPETNIPQYQCEIITQYEYLHEISFYYGNVLLNEDEINIFHASKAVVEAFDAVMGDLKAMYVPEQMAESHRILIKSVNSYSQSARNMQKAIGIFIGEYDGNENNSLELIDIGEKQVIIGNKYLGQSLDMHEKLFVQDCGSF